MLTIYRFCAAKVGSIFETTKYRRKFFIFFQKKDSTQVQLASAKLAICLKNSVLGVEKSSFLRGLKFSLRPTLQTKLSEKSLKLDFLGIYCRSTVPFCQEQ